MERAIVVAARLRVSTKIAEAETQPKTRSGGDVEIANRHARVLPLLWGCRVVYREAPGSFPVLGSR